MALKVKVNDPHFQYQLCASKDAYLVQIGWFHLKFVICYLAEKLKFTGGQAQAGNDNNLSIWKVKGWKKTVWDTVKYKRYDMYMQFHLIHIQSDLYHNKGFKTFVK